MCLMCLSFFPTTEQANLSSRKIVWPYMLPLENPRFFGSFFRVGSTNPTTNSGPTFLHHKPWSYSWNPPCHMGAIFRVVVRFFEIFRRWGGRLGWKWKDKRKAWNKQITWKILGKPMFFVLGGFGFLEDFLNGWLFRGVLCWFPGEVLMLMMVFGCGWWWFLLLMIFLLN